jgi:(4S)-4-hydroxy-5-phosphonooxypentane-2,3-dione isomerase
MYVVLVDFVTKPEKAAAFAHAVSENAKASLSQEPDCHQFDVCVSPDEPSAFFLYEIYSDRAGFDAHLATPHFKSFDQMVEPWIADKKVRFLERIET